MMILQHLGRPGFELATFGGCLLCLLLEPFEHRLLTGVEPAAIDAAEFGAGFGCVEQHKRVARLVHVLFCRHLKALLAAPGAIEMQAGTSLDFWGEKVE